MATNSWQALPGWVKVVTFLLGAGAAVAGASFRAGRATADVSKIPTTVSANTVAIQNNGMAIATNSARITALQNEVTHQQQMQRVAHEAILCYLEELSSEPVGNFKRCAALTLRLQDPPPPS